MAREYFCAYYSYLASLKNLSDAECGRLFRALLQYGAGGELINLQGREGIAFDFMVAQIERDNAKYEEFANKQRECGKKGGRPKNPTLFEETQKTQPFLEKPKKAKEKEKEKENNKEKTTNVVQKKGFSPPSVEEVAEYCRQRRNGIDAETFVDYYTARGWVYNGGQKVKDWQAAVRTWEKNRKSQPKEEADRYADLI